jgi:hypothetical protein
LRDPCQFGIVFQRAMVGRGKNLRATRLLPIIGHRLTNGVAGEERLVLHIAIPNKSILAETEYFGNDFADLLGKHVPFDSQFARSFATR